MKKKNTYLSFSLGKEVFAVGVKKVLEVVKQPELTCVPGIPQHIAGIMNFRGDIIPVVDLRIKFGFAKPENDKKSVTIVFEIKAGDNTAKIGAVTDTVRDVIQISDKKIMKVPEMGSRFDNAKLLGMFRSENTFIMLPDMDKILAEESREKLDESLVNQTISTENTVNH